MPGEVITIDAESYPDIANIEDGEQVSLKVTGTKNTTEDGQIEITTDSITRSDVNPAKEALRGMTPKQGKKMPMMGAEEEEY